MNAKVHNFMTTHAKKLVQRVKATDGGEGIKVPLLGGGSGNEERKDAPRGLVPTLVSSPVTTKSSSKSSFRRSRRRSYFAGADGLYCGTNGATFIMRLLMILPSPLFAVALFLMDEENRRSRAMDAVRVPLQMSNMFCLGLSRAIVAAAKAQYPTWGKFEILELAVVVLGCIVSVLLIYPPADAGKHQIKTAGITNTSYVTPLGSALAGYILVTPMLHMVIKQVMIAQKKSFTGFVADSLVKFGHTLFVVLILCFYGTNVLMGETLKSIPRSIELIPLGLSAQFNCRNEESFALLFRNSTYEKSGCPRGGQNTTEDWCGYSAWYEACWEIAILPASQAVKDSIEMVSLHLFAMLLASMVLVGRGMIKRDKDNGLDKASIKYITSASTMWIISCMLFNSVISIYQLSQLTVNGGILSAPIPHPPPANPKLPSYCYGECMENLYMVFLFAMFSAVVAGGIDYVDKCWCIDNRAKNAKLQLGMQEDSSLLTTEELEHIMLHIDALPSPEEAMEGAQVEQAGGKFRSRELVTGMVEEAAQGLGKFLCVEDEHMQAIAILGEKAIIDEVEKLGNPEVSEFLRYILHDKCSEKQYQNGTRDVGREGWTLDDFMEHEYVQKAGLKRAHVIALRLYTTAAYKEINNPLRDRSRFADNRPHPLAATVKFISDGIKKLRAVIAQQEAQDRKDGKLHDSVVLWRGMKNMHTSRSFNELGGVELAPMSTTSNFHVAVEYGTCSTGSMLFKINVPNALMHGADLQWLSAFPGEAEVLYPPLTHLQPTGKRQRLKSERSQVEVTIIELQPDLSASSD